MFDVHIAMRGAGIRLYVSTTAKPVKFCRSIENAARTLFIFALHTHTHSQPITVHNLEIRCDNLQSRILQLTIHCTQHRAGQCNAYKYEVMLMALSDLCSLWETLVCYMAASSYIYRCSWWMCIVRANEAVPLSQQPELLVWMLCRQRCENLAYDPPRR